MRTGFLYDDDVLGVVTIDFLFRQQVAHPAIGEGLAEPGGQIVHDLRGVYRAVAFDQRVAFAGTGE